mmetsp:Transcript_38350/g.86417  ORF Transcript_38350/g.86417 Transcript_38350/m.86417 type:complete len:219 (-) Transcript_38350:340-996(-)
MSPHQESRVISWNMVKRERMRLPKRSWMWSSSWNTSRLPISSVAATAKTYRMTSAMTKVQNRGLTDVISPWMRIQSSLKKGFRRTLFARRASRRVRMTVKMRRKPTSTPEGSSIHLMRTPVTKTSTVSQKLANSNTQTQPNASIRRHHSRKKSMTKKCSQTLKKSLRSSPSVEASQPMTKLFRIIMKPMPISNFMEVTMPYVVGYGFMKKSSDRFARS